MTLLRIQHFVSISKKCVQPSELTLWHLLRVGDLTLTSDCVCGHYWFGGYHGILFQLSGFWSEMLGMGTFYYDVAIQSIEIILASPINGGVMSLGVLQQRLSRSRSQNASLKDASVSW